MKVRDGLFQRTDSMREIGDALPQSCVSARIARRCSMMMLLVSSVMRSLEHEGMACFSLLHFFR